jgi:hypothetical protein
VWQDGDPATTGRDIYGGLLRGDGTPSGPSAHRGFRISSGDDDFSADVAYGLGWGYLVAWTRQHPVPWEWDVYGNHVMPGHDSPAGGEFALDNTYRDQDLPVLACQPVGDCFLAEENAFWSSSAEIGASMVRLDKVYLPMTVRQ